MLNFVELNILTHFQKKSINIKILNQLHNNIIMKINKNHGNEVEL
jgi:hypothetical protein